MKARGARWVVTGAGLSLGLVAACTLTGACSGTVAAPPRYDGVARVLAPPPDHALLYVIRPEFMGQGIRFDVLVNGTWIGATGGFRYVFTYLKPGHYLIQSRAENVADLRLTVHAGRTYFVEQQPQMGLFMPGNALVLLPEEVGRRRMRPCSLSAAMPREVLAYAMSLGQGARGFASPGAPGGAAPAGASPGRGAGRAGAPDDAPPGAKQGRAPAPARPEPGAPSPPRSSEPPPPPAESF